MLVRMRRPVRQRSPATPKAPEWSRLPALSPLGDPGLEPGTSSLSGSERIRADPGSLAGICRWIRRLGSYFRVAAGRIVAAEASIRLPRLGPLRLRSADHSDARSGRWTAPRRTFGCRRFPAEQQSRDSGRIVGRESRRKALDGVARRGRGWRPRRSTRERRQYAQRQARRSVPAAFSIACSALPGLSCQGTGFTGDGYSASRPLVRTRPRESPCRCVRWIPAL